MSTAEDFSNAAEVAASAGSVERPLGVADLDQSFQANSWIKKPLYYTHHRKANHEQLSQVIRLPPMHRHVQFTASEGATWDGISQNAWQAMQKRLGKTTSFVVLLYCAPCNPFHLGDVDSLQRARASLDTLKDVCVVGALVVPFGDETLKERGASEDRRLPFALRRDVTRTVLQTAHQNNWVIVDTCLGTAEDQVRSEGCMRHVAGSIAPFLSVYARGRLHCRNHDIRVVEVRSEDPLEGSRCGRPLDHVHVEPGKSASAPIHGPSGEPPGLATIGTLVVDVPKQSQCDDMLWCAVKHPQDRSNFQAIERFCGTSAARLITDWSNKKNASNRGKAKLLNG